MHVKWDAPRLMILGTSGAADRDPIGLTAGLAGI